MNPSRAASLAANYGWVALSTSSARVDGFCWHNGLHPDTLPITPANESVNSWIMVTNCCALDDRMFIKSYGDAHLLRAWPNGSTHRRSRRAPGAIARPQGHRSPTQPRPAAIWRLPGVPRPGQPPPMCPPGSTPPGAPETPPTAHLSLNSSLPIYQIPARFISIPRTCSPSSMSRVTVASVHGT